MFAPAAPPPSVGRGRWRWTPRALDPRCAARLAQGRGGVRERLHCVELEDEEAERNEVLWWVVWRWDLGR